MTANIYSQAAYESEPQSLFPGLSAKRTGNLHQKRFRLLTVADLLQRQPAPWLIKNLWPRKGIAAIFGPSGSGKTFLAISMMGAISTGTEWFGYHVGRAPVVYIVLEGIHGVSQRFTAHIREVGPVGDLHLIESDMSLVSLHDEHALVETIAEAGLAGARIIIDTFAQATVGMDENSGEDMTRAISACKRIQEKTDGLVVLIHHTGKDAGRGMRGHSSLIGAIDAAIEVSGGQDGSPRQWTARKVKDGEGGRIHPFALRRVVLGTDDDGDEISSCIVEATEATGDAVRRAKVPSGGNQKIVWDALGDLLKNSRQFGMADAPATRPCINLTDAIDQVRGRLPTDQKRQTERMREAITGLISKGLIKHSEGWLWIS